MPRPLPRALRFAVCLVATAASLTALVAGSLLFGTLTILTAWVPPRGTTIAWFARAWSWVWLWFSGVRLEVSRAPALAVGGDYVYLANHASWLDIPALLATLPGRVRFAAKRGLFQIPVFGWALKAGGFIPVDRGDKARARDAIGSAISELRSGGSVLFFPEGTRSADGLLAPFQRGGFLLALKTGLPIVPVGIRGSLEVLPRSTFWVSPGPIQVSYGAPVDVTAYGIQGRKELVEVVRRRIAELAQVELR